MPRYVDAREGGRGWFGWGAIAALLPFAPLALSLFLAGAEPSSRPEPTSAEMFGPLPSFEPEAEAVRAVLEAERVATMGLEPKSAASVPHRGNR